MLATILFFLANTFLQSVFLFLTFLCVVIWEMWCLSGVKNFFKHCLSSSLSTLRCFVSSNIMIPYTYPVILICSLCSVTLVDYKLSAYLRRQLTTARSAK